MNDQFLIRRTMAVCAFIAIILTLFLCLGIAVIADEQMAKNLREIGLIVGPIIVCLTANITHYAQLVHKTDVRKA